MSAYSVPKVEPLLFMKCVCPIEYVITYKFKVCPLVKWNV